MAIRKLVTTALAASTALGIVLEAPQPNFATNIFELSNFTFTSGESLPKLRLHYHTLGTVKRDENNKTTNAVLLMHTVASHSGQFQSQSYIHGLFDPSQPLDANDFFIIIPDAIGHGNSSKPSNELKARFPHYNYRDIVRAAHQLLAEGLAVNHLRLCMGTWMGGMNCWLWAGMFPDEVDAVFTLASVPSPPSSRTEIIRKMIVDSIVSDPAYKGGEYTEQPRLGLTNALNADLSMTLAPTLLQKIAPDAKASSSFLDKIRNLFIPLVDGNDMLYQWSAASDFDATPLLGNITARVMAVNTADDAYNPPELGILEESMKRVPKGQSVVIPQSKDTLGHLSYVQPALWKELLVKLLEESKPT
ncbi:homoserine O-acetyltransferase [Ophiocordyceps camponoti-floridani]|uniref:Homoserine O-acetyltransferase n=1 Tax=Ophiocordyceps camponoti-floridani TaxID=2030778 RepID=A0A8H4VEK2_9HYPO|nr:homoserine O-acetyltransferase [Ophiocordyceps camponoti-floridani]